MKHTIIYLVFLSVTHNTHTTTIRLTKEQAQRIGQQIWKNECGGTIQGLTHWVKGEPCASLGIGHFIWYPKTVLGKRYTQTFPTLLTYFEKHKVPLPSWLKETKNYCPWQSHTDFFANKKNKQMLQLRTLLANHIAIQTQFIVDRMIRALPTMLKHVSSNKRARVKRQFYRVAQSSNGLYALIDYINFKGEGINPQERYNGNGWGLLQVLEYMQSATVGKNATHEFAQAAEHVLKQRVNNAPKSNCIDKKFLPGWLNRIQTYRKS